MEVGGFIRNAAEYEDGDLDKELTVGGAYGAFALWSDLGTFRIGLDGYVEGINADDSNDTTPIGIGVLGAHVGANLDAGYLGLFGALGVYPDGDNEELVSGYTVGVEGSAQFDAVTAFAKAGYAFAPAPGYDASNNDLEGFVGLFAEAGLTYALSDDLAVLGSVGFGHSDDFDFEQAPGGYVSWGAKFAYRLPTELNLNLVASYDGYYAYSTDDDEQIVEHTFKLGLSIPFGDTGTAAQALNPLATSLTPFRAGYSSDAL